jgi:hypothetical protein
VVEVEGPAVEVLTDQLDGAPPGPGQRGHEAMLAGADWEEGERGPASGAGSAQGTPPAEAETGVSVGRPAVGAGSPGAAGQAGLATVPVRPLVK